MPSKNSRVNSNDFMSVLKKQQPVVDKYSPMVGFSIIIQIATLILITFILNWLNKIKKLRKIILSF